MGNISDLYDNIVLEKEDNKKTGSISDLYDNIVVGETKPKEEDYSSIEKLLDQSDEKEGLNRMEKIGLSALPIVGGIGAAALAANPLSLSAIGLGALGTGAFKAVSDIIEPTLGGKDRTASEIGERALKEGVLDAVFTTATLGLGKALKPITRPMTKFFRSKLYNLAKPVLEKERVGRRISKLNHDLFKLKKVLNEKESIVDRLVTQTKKTSDDFLADIDKDLSLSIKKVARPMSKYIAAAKHSLNSQYDNFFAKYGNINVTNSGMILDEIDKIDSLLVDKVLKTANLNEIGDLTLNESNVLRRKLGDFIKKLNSQGDNITADTVHGLREGLQSLMEHSDVDGVLKQLNKKYKDYSFVKKAAKALKIPESRKESKEAFKTGRDYIAASLESILKSASKEGKITEGINKSLNDFLSATKAMEVTGSPALIARAKVVQSKISDMTKKAMSKKKILDNLNIMKLGEKVHTPTGILRREIDEIKKDILKKQTGKDLLMTAKEKLTKEMGMSSLLPIFITGQAVADLPFVPPEAKKTIRLLTALFTIKKWSPRAANILLRSAKNFEKNLAKYNLSDRNKRIISRFLSEIAFQATND